MDVKYFSVTYAESRQRSHTGSFHFTTFGMEEVIDGWRLGLPGMRLGGRRELVVPQRLGDAGTTAIYVIDLLAIHRRSPAE